MRAAGGLRSRVVVAAVAALVAVALAVVFGVWLAPLDETFALLGQFAAPAAVLAAVAAGAAAVLRRRALLISAAAVTVALGAPLLGQLFAPPPSAPPGVETVRLYLANTGRQTRSADAVVRSVRAARADVVALVEVSPELRAALPRRLPEYAYVVDGSTAWDRPRAHRGLLVLSRWPLRKASEIDPAAASPAERAAVLRRVLAPEHVGALDVEVQAPSGVLRLVAGHVRRPWPFSPRGLHAAKVSDLGRTVRDGDIRRTVLVGDFNATPATPALREMAQATGLRPARSVPGTWPAVVPPLFRIGIDNVFAGPAWTIVERRLAAPTGSDHAPVLVRLAPVG